MGKQVLPRGEVYFDPFDANGDKTGERFLGNAPALTLTQSHETLEHHSSTGAVRELDKEVVISITRAIGLTLDEITKENLEMFISGDLSEHSQTAQTGASETLTGVKHDRHYQIGQTAANPAGTRPLTSVTVTGAGGTPSYTEDTDYELDLTLGRIKILSTGSIADGSDIVVSFDAPAKTWFQIKSSDKAVVKGALRYLAYPGEGDPVDHYFAEVQLAPDGELVLVTESDWQQLAFSGNVIKPTTGEAHYIDGRPA